MFSRLTNLPSLGSKRIGLLLPLTLVALVALGVVSVLGARDLIESSRWVNHTLAVMQDLERTYVALYDVQAAQRSYIILGEERYVQDFNDAIQGMETQLQHIRRLTAGDSRQQDRLRHIAPLIKRRIESAEETIGMRREQGFEAAKAEIITGAGSRLMQQVRQAIDSMIDEERSLLDHRMHESDLAARWLIAAICAGVTVTALLLVLVYALLRRDIAQRARAATALRLSEERFRSFMDNIPALAFIKDPAGRFSYRNAAFQRMFQLECTEVVGDLEGERWLEQAARQFEGNDRRVRETGQALETFESVVMPSGQRRDWLVYRFLVPDSTGELLLGGVAIDVTERKQLEERFRQAVELCPNGMIMIDREGKIVLTNRQTERMFGYAREELIGQSVDRLVPERFRAQHPEHRRTFMQAPAARLMGQGRDLAGLRKNGSEFPVEIGLQPIVTKEGLFVLSAIVDITERKQAEAAMRRFTARLEQSNRELQDFAYVSSHDLQEPLRKIQAFGDRLQTQFSASLPEQGLDYVQRMQKAAARMRTLIEDLLQFSRVTTKAQPFASTDLGMVVQEVLGDLEVAIERTGGRVSVEELPTIDADPLQMRQLFQNLIGNALKFRRPDEPPSIVIRSTVLKEDGYPGGPPKCQITVEDNGIGFESRYADRIFEVFQRLHERDQYEGSGIGLSICRKIVERHGGSIHSSSTPGLGSTFIVTLPLHQFDKQEREEPLCHSAEKAFSC